MVYHLRERDRDRLIGLLDAIEGGDGLDEGAPLTPREAARLARDLVEGVRARGALAPAGVWLLTLEGEIGALAGDALRGELPQDAARRLLARFERPAHFGTEPPETRDGGWTLWARLDDGTTPRVVHVRHYPREALRRYALLTRGVDLVDEVALPPQHARSVLAGLLTHAPHHLEVVATSAAGSAFAREDGGAYALAWQGGELVAFELRDEGAA